MDSLLGMITRVTGRTRPERTDGLQTYDVTFKPVCVMPRRTKVPEWLKDQELTVSRSVADSHELGGRGDSIVLGPSESAKWLCPLCVDPPVTRGGPPARLRLRLQWWKTKKPERAVVSAAGRQRAVSWQKDGKQFKASVPTRALLGPTPTLPASVAVKFGPMAGECTVLPDARPGYAKLVTPNGVRQRLESPWYTAELSTEQGGGITSLCERGRGNDHFRQAADRIRDALDLSGHVDRVDIGWPDKLREVRMTCAGPRLDGDAVGVVLDGVVDKGRNIRTSASYSLLRDAPLLVLRRELLLLKGEEKKDKDKDKHGKPKVPRDDLVRVALAFRTAFAPDTTLDGGTRILSIDRDRFAVVRHTKEPDWFGHGWRLRDGWVLVEHPSRQEATLILLDRHAPPTFGTRHNDMRVTVEGRWTPFPGIPERGSGFSLAMSAGEQWGAARNGAWVACRRKSENGGVTVAVVGRFAESVPDPTARIQLGRHEVEVPVQTLHLSGVGRACSAVAEFPAGRMRSKLGIAVAGIERRR